MRAGRWSSPPATPRGKTTRVLVVGTGPGAVTPEAVRRGVAAAALWARERRHRTIAIDLAGLAVDAEAATAAAAEAVVLANFNHGHLKSAEPLPGIREASVLVADGQRVQLERGLVIGEAINAARLLANEPGNVLTPARAGGARRRADRRARRGRRDPRPGSHRGARHGPAARRRPRVERAAAAALPDLHAARRRHRTGARPGRQGRHLRHRRHLDQAGRRHGADEGRHGRRGRGDLGRARHRAGWESRAVSSRWCRPPRTCRAATRSSPATCSAAPPASPSRSTTPTPRAG